MGMLIALRICSPKNIQNRQLSNPPVLCLAALRASCELFDRATMPRLLRKSRMLTAYLAALLARDALGEDDARAAAETEARALALFEGLVQAGDDCGVGGGGGARKSHGTGKGGAEGGAIFFCAVFWMYQYWVQEMISFTYAYSNTLAK